MIWFRFGEWIIRRRFLVLLVIGAMTTFFGYFASKTELVTSFGDLLPQNHPFIQVAHERACFRAGHAFAGVYFNSFHCGEVDHYPGIAHPVPKAAVASTMDR